MEWVQFHQSYSYEDFIQGFRPSAVGYELRDGIFYRFCERAGRDKGRPYVFVIDEINRGNLSRIFGEVLSLLEDDKRDVLSVTLAYSGTSQSLPDHAAGVTQTTKNQFSVPSNLLVIGLMNTADRSLAVVDYALRRRFAFVDLVPRFEDEKFKKLLFAQGISASMTAKIAERVQNLNQRITADKRNLGRGFEIGHSFFCPRKPVSDEEEWYRSIIKYEIAPLLREYWFEDPDKAAREVERLAGGNPD